MHNDTTYTIHRGAEAIQDAVDALLRDPYNDGSYTRQQIEAALWTWLTDSVTTLVESAVDYSHGPQPFGLSFSGYLREAAT